MRSRGDVLFRPPIFKDVSQFVHWYRMSFFSHMDFITNSNSKTILSWSDLNTIYVFFCSNKKRFPRMVSFFFFSIPIRILSKVKTIVTDFIYKFLAYIISQIFKFFFTPYRNNFVKNIKYDEVERTTWLPYCYAHLVILEYRSALVWTFEVDTL